MFLHPWRRMLGCTGEQGVLPDWESLLTARRPQSGQKKMERQVPAWSGYLRRAGRRHTCWLSGAEEMQAPLERP